MATYQLVTKLGSWGGVGGSPRDMNAEASKRLESITVRSGSLVDSIQFSYIDFAGQKDSVGPWGGDGGQPHTIQLAESEFVKQLSGTINEIRGGGTVVTSIKFVTNLNKTYGPWGAGAGKDVPFTAPVPPGCAIVGFFGRSGSYLDAIGVYVRPLPVTKLGTWGGSGGSPQDMTEADASKRLESITVRSGSLVDSIQFSYIDFAGQKDSAGPWGGDGGQPHTIQLAESEFVKQVSGTINEIRGGGTMVTSIKFVTNLNKTYGPWGAGAGKDVPFAAPVPPGCAIVGFFGRSGSYLDAIGVYVRPLPVTKLGTWGGSGGSPQDMTEADASKRLESITVRSGSLVDSIAFTYIDFADQKHSSGPWGGNGGQPHTIQLAESEFVIEVSGTINVIPGSDYAVSSIKFVTNLNKTYGPWGSGDGKDVPFSAPVPQGSGVVGFFARSGDYLDAIGVYVRPL